MKTWTIEPYGKQCKASDLWQFIEESLALKGFPFPMHWVRKRDIDNLEKKRKIFLAMMDGKMVGCLIIKKSNIEILCVRKRYRRHGIGESLVKYAISVLKKDKRRKYVRVDSLHNFKAKRFYERLGFRDYVITNFDQTWHMERAI